jgi:hypothetical protein
VKDDEMVLAHPRLERVYGTVADYALAEAHVAGCEAIVHTTVLFPRSPKVRMVPR